MWFTPLVLSVVPKLWKWSGALRKRVTALASREVLKLVRKPRNLLNVVLDLWNMLVPGMRPQETAFLTNPHTS